MSFYDLNAKFRPIDVWPGAETKTRTYSPFSAEWSATTELLGRELRNLGARNIVCQIALREQDIRLDGYPKANARPTHPGVILAFESNFGPLKYACDRFSDWRDNVRAIALGLEALRKVERYGITKRGEQYTGFRALPASTQPVMTTEAAARFIGGFTRGVWQDLVRSAEVVAAAYRIAARACHPDTGGSTEQFQQLQEAKRVLDAHHGGQ